MGRYLLAATAIWLAANAAPAVAQGAQDTTSRQQNEAPVSAQDRPPEPANPLPEGEDRPDVRDYQTPAEPGKEALPGPAPGTRTTRPGVPAIPPGAAETPSTPPATSPRDVEPSAGGGLPAGYVSVEKYLEADLGKRQDLAGKPVVLPDGEQVGTINEFVVRDGRRYAHLSLSKTASDRKREVVVSLDKLYLSPDGDRVRLEAGSREELEKLPEYLPESYQSVR